MYGIDAHDIIKINRECSIQDQPVRYDQLFERDETVLDTVKGLLNGTIQVEGFNDAFALCEFFILDVEDRWTGENTTKAWLELNEFRQQELALIGYPW